MDKQTSNGNDPVGAVIAVILLTCVGASMFQVEPFFLGAVADSLGLNGRQIGLLAGVELAGAAIGSVAASFWVPHFNWRMVAFLSVTVVFAGNLWSATLTEFEPLLGLRFATGLLGQGTAYCVALAVINRMRNPERVFGLAIAAQVGLTMIFMLYLPRLISEFGAAGVLVPLAVFAACVLPLLSQIPKTGTRVEMAMDTASHRALAIVLLALAAQVVWYTGVGAVWAFIERIGAASQIEPAQIGSALALAMAAGLGGALLASAYGHRANRLAMFVLAMLLQIGALFALMHAGSWPVFAVAAMLFNASWNYALPFLLGIIVANDASGRFTVLLIAVQGAGVAIGPVVAGILSETVGLVAVSWFGIAACAVSAAVLLSTVLLRKAF